MEKIQIDMFIASSLKTFPPERLHYIREQLEKMDDNKFIMLSALKFKDPDTAVILAFVLACDRLYLEDIGLGILKLILIFFVVGLIWWLIDIFSAANRAREYNMNLFNRYIMY
jgi:TM2 domain-containing membrane protein YozV